MMWGGIGLMRGNTGFSSFGAVQANMGGQGSDGGGASPHIGKPRDIKSKTNIIIVVP